MKIRVLHHKYEVVKYYNSFAIKITRDGAGSGSGRIRGKNWIRIRSGSENVGSVPSLKITHIF